MLFKAYGVNLGTLKTCLCNTPRYVRDYWRYRRLCNSNSYACSSFKAEIRKMVLCLTDFDDSAGDLGTYFHQDLWAARKIYIARPSGHIDVGSRIDGFISHLLCFRDVTVIDIRCIESAVRGLSFMQADATTLSALESGSAESLSSLHAAEHFGLGRYGDPIDPDACFKFMDSLQRVLKVNGTLYFSVPIGNERLIFNAQRVFSPFTILERFKHLELVSFSAIVRGRGVIENAPLESYIKEHYSCGLFEFRKIKP